MPLTNRPHQYRRPPAATHADLDARLHQMQEAIDRIIHRLRAEMQVSGQRLADLDRRVAELEQRADGPGAPQ